MRRSGSIGSMVAYCGRYHVSSCRYTNHSALIVHIWIGGRAEWGEGGEAFHCRSYLTAPNARCENGADQSLACVRFLRLSKVQYPWLCDVEQSWFYGVDSHNVF